MSYYSVKWKQGYLKFKVNSDFNVINYCKMSLKISIDLVLPLDYGIIGLLITLDFQQCQSTLDK